MEWKTKDGNYIDSLVRDIIEHYESNRACLLTGKAMVVAYSRPIAMKIYRKMLELRPIWTETVAVVMTSTNDDDESWRTIIGNKHRRDELAAKFKDNTSPLKIAIVVDMWLTGFDVPSLATMYIYKPMAGHNLMQAIARVNRVFQDKEGGLMLKLARQITAAEQEGKKLGLSAEESAFYDALTKPEAIKDFYKNDELIAMTKALTETLRKNKTIDWSRKTGARAHMRMLIKRLLKKYDYPPAGVEDAVETVMSQCEVWTDNLMELDSSAAISSNTIVQKENVKAAQTTNSKAAAIKDTMSTQSYTGESLAAETSPRYGSKP